MKLSKTFLEDVEEKFLMQLVNEPIRKVVLFMNRKGLDGDV